MSRLIVTPLLLIYSPIGLILVFIRSLLLIYVFLASVILYTVSPVKRIILRFMCSLLGFIVTSEGTSVCSREQPLVSNCITLFDHMAMNLLTNCVTPHKFMLSWALTWRHLNYEETNCRNKISDIFHIQPEETPTGTNTNVILKFNPGPFRLFNKVQPVAISVTKYLPINLSIHPIDWKYEIFWVLFSPMIRVHVKFLPPVIRSTDDDQSIDKFVETVRIEIARNLNAKIVDTDRSKFWIMSGEHFPVINVPDVSNQNYVIEKYDIAVENQAHENFIPDELDNSNKDPRVEQVLAVLPNAKSNQVRSLIEVDKKNVDQYGHRIMSLTALIATDKIRWRILLTNIILENLDDVDSVIAYLLEQTDISNVSNTKSNSKMMHIAPSCHKLAASKFSRQPEERHKSFTERKALFLENARQSYLETHKI